MHKDQRISVEKGKDQVEEASQIQPHQPRIKNDHQDQTSR